MMIALMALYLALLFSLVWLGLIRFNTFWKVPMGYGDCRRLRVEAAQG